MNNSTSSSSSIGSGSNSSNSILNSRFPIYHHSTPNTSTGLRGGGGGGELSDEQYPLKQPLQYGTSASYQAFLLNNHNNNNNNKNNNNNYYPTSPDVNDKLQNFSSNGDIITSPQKHYNRQLQQQQQQQPQIITRNSNINLNPSLHNFKFEEDDSEYSPTVGTPNNSISIPSSPGTTYISTPSSTCSTPPPPPPTPSPLQSPSPILPIYINSFTSPTTSTSSTNNQQLITPANLTTTTSTTSTASTTSTTPTRKQQQQQTNIENKSIQDLVLDLMESNKREDTLAEISKRKDHHESMNLAFLLWNTPVIMTILIQEVINIYRYITPPTPKLKARASGRVCNTLVLFQTIASHPEYRSHFVNSKIFVYVYPFLKTTSKTKPFEFLRLNSLNVISSVIKVEIKDVLKFLLESDITTPCAKIMETGTELSKTVATFILQKILNEDEGLNYFAKAPAKLTMLFTSLASMVDAMLPDKMSSRLLKHIIRCYLRLSDNSRARELLHQSLPKCFSNGHLDDFLNQEGDMIVKRWYHQLMSNVYPATNRSSHNNKKKG